MSSYVKAAAPTEQPPIQLQPMTDGPPPPYSAEPYAPMPTQAAASPQVVYVVGPQEFGTKPMRVFCSHCNKDVVTVTKETSCNGKCCAQALTMIFCCLILIVVGCCVTRVPSGGCTRVEHFCPNCQQLLGTYEPN